MGGAPPITDGDPGVRSVMSRCDVAPRLSPAHRHADHRAEATATLARSTPVAVKFVAQPPDRLPPPGVVGRQRRVWRVRPLYREADPAVPAQLMDQVGAVVPDPGVVPVSTYTARQCSSFSGRDRRTEHPLDDHWQWLVGVARRLGAVGDVPPSMLLASPGRVCSQLPKATRLFRSTAVGVGAFVSEPELPGVMQLLDGPYQRGRILLRIPGNPRAEAEMVICGPEAVRCELDHAGPQVRMPDIRGQTLVVDPSLVRPEAAHPTTLRSVECGSQFTFAARGRTGAGHTGTTSCHRLTPPRNGGYSAFMSVTTMTLRIPDELAPSIRAAASGANMSVNAWIVRAARRAATLDAAHQLADLGLGDELAGEGDAL